MQQHKTLRTRIGEKLVKAGGGVTAGGLFKRLQKLNTMAGLGGSTGYGQLNMPAPPYQRHFSPLWIYLLRRDAPLLNNAMRQKIWQTFRGGLGEWQKAYDAKCPTCRHEFRGFEAFRQQMGETAEDLADDEIDLDSERVCPECEEVVEMLTPDPTVKERAQAYFDRANERETDGPTKLEPMAESSVSQTFVDVLEEIAWDIQSFDDGWLLFERSYTITAEGVIIDYDLEETMRGPPELMRWCVDEETNDPGGQYWVCIECRATDDEYRAEETDQRCSDCGNVTYPAYAVATTGPAGQGGEVDEYFIRGEFYHDSEYERKRFYGYPPVLTLWEEARTVEQMDKWYNDAYEQRRAPRGVISVNAARDTELREFNKKQVERMRADPNYIPLVMNDSEEEGDPIQFIELLKEPAAMQHMEMREWFLDRISAHFGVTAVLMEGSPGDSGLSQSMEVEVSEKQAEHFRAVLNSFIDAYLAQIGTEGWTRELLPVEEEDPEREAQLVGQHLNNAEKALRMGREVEWTDEDRATIKPGEMENPEEGMDGMGMGGMVGGIPGQEGPDPMSLEPGDDPNAPHVDEPGERSPAEGPDDPDRPAATPLKSLAEAIEGDGDLRKVGGADGPGRTVPRDDAEAVAVEALG